jgi:5-formyltetrahydrofolate cyclo-ligase
MKNPSKSFPDKQDLRRNLIAARRALPELAKAQADARIAAQLSRWLAAHQVKLLGVYLPMPSEPDLTSLYAQLHGSGVKLAMPLVLKKNTALRYAAWQPGDAMAKDVSGTMAPLARTGFVEPEVVLAPCLGFTETRLRLGYGGGYFDRTLAREPRPLAIGIAYASAKVEFAASAHDVALDLIMTD